MEVTSQLIRVGIMNANPVNAQVAGRRVKYIECSEINLLISSAYIRPYCNKPFFYLLRWSASDFWVV